MYSSRRNKSISMIGIVYSPIERITGNIFSLGTVIVKKNSYGIKHLIIIRIKHRSKYLGLINKVFRPYRKMIQNIIIMTFDAKTEENNDVKVKSMVIPYEYDLCAALTVLLIFQLFFHHSDHILTMPP